MVEGDRHQIHGSLRHLDGTNTGPEPLDCQLAICALLEPVLEPVLDRRRARSRGILIAASGKGSHKQYSRSLIHNPESMHGCCASREVMTASQRNRMLLLWAMVSSRRISFKQWNALYRVS